MRSSSGEILTGRPSRGISDSLRRLSQTGSNYLPAPLALERPFG